MIRREESAVSIGIVNGKARKGSAGRADYLLRVKPPGATQPVAIAVIEAKRNSLPPAHGLEQAKAYADSKRLNVRFVFSSNGHQYVMFDSNTGLTNAPLTMNSFPTPSELTKAYEKAMGFSLADEKAKPLLTAYKKGEASRRYYQDAAIRAVFEHIATGNKRALLSLATGSGKTFIAVNLLRRIADSGQLKRALFICDRDELRQQAVGAFQNEFGSDAAPATANKPEKNARVVVATYQTLGVDTEDGDASYLKRNYPENYFSHIIIDECHRSAWGKWSEVLQRNTNAIQIGLTATPREFEYTTDDETATQDKKITADNVRYFGEPVYEYSIGQAMADGFLAAMEIHKENVFLQHLLAPERVTGIGQAELANVEVSDPDTGQPLSTEAIAQHYDATSFESRLLIPERVSAMCQKLFENLCNNGGPEQKTIIFCARDRHADAVSIEMNNLYANWCEQNGINRVSQYAFKCTSAGGSEQLEELRGRTRGHFIATTVDLLTTGVDIPNVKNVVFFRYVQSPIAFYQMVGRGTRLHPQSGKLMFRVHDYTNATRLFGETFKKKWALTSTDGTVDHGNLANSESEMPIQVEGVDVRISTAGIWIGTTDYTGKLVHLTLEEYKQRLAESLLETVDSLDNFREIWVDAGKRHAMMARLPDDGRAASIVRNIEDREKEDLYDVLADIAYGMAPKLRSERAEAFTYKSASWLSNLPDDVEATLTAIASQFERDGTTVFETSSVFDVPSVRRAGGINALVKVDEPRGLLEETKRRVFAA
jgi:type I restriction enzyme R subunit